MSFTKQFDELDDLILGLKTRANKMEKEYADLQSSLSDVEDEFDECSDSVEDLKCTIQDLEERLACCANCWRMCDVNNPRGKCSNWAAR